MSDDPGDVLNLDTSCDCGCRRCARQKSVLWRALSAILHRKRTTASERLTGAITKEGRRPGPGRPRGQQRGQPGHGRRRYEQVPLAEEVVVEPPGMICGTCGQPYELVAEASNDELDFEVVVRRKRTRRPAYRPVCRCAGNRSLAQAPPPPKLVSKGLLTVGTVAWLLLLKYELALPMQRICGLLKMTGVGLAPGTVAGVFERVAPMLEPLAACIRGHTALAPHLHSDETGHRLLGPAREVVGRKHVWLWVLVGHESVSYLIAKSRATAELVRHLGLDPEHPQLGEGRDLVLSCDRFSANLSLFRLCPEIVPALCWAHVRRDFWELRGRRGLKEWAPRWLRRIARLFREHRAWDHSQAPDGSTIERRLHRRVLAALAEIEQALERELEAAELPSPALKALVSLDKHWFGLVAATESRGIPLDNNAAERALRNAVIVERNCLGSAAEWSAQLAADFWTVAGTARMAGFNPKPYLTAYLDACRLAGGRAPADLEPFLPWAASSADRERWTHPEPDTS